MSDTVEQYPAAGGANPAAGGANPAAGGANPAAGKANAAAAGAIPATPNPGYPVNFDTPNPAIGGGNAAAAAAGAIPAAPNPGYPVNFDTPNPGYPVNFDTPFGNLSFSLRGWERVVFMIFVAVCILLAVAYIIKKLVEDGEGKK